MLVCSLIGWWSFAVKWFWPVWNNIYDCEISGCYGACIKMTVFGDVVPYSLVETDRRFRCAYCLHHQGDEWWWRQKAPLKRRSIYTRLHGATFQKMVIFNIYDVCVAITFAMVMLLRNRAEAPWIWYSELLKKKQTHLDILWRLPDVC
jgi:hypothetical protein